MKTMICFLKYRLCLTGVWLLLIGGMFGACKDEAPETENECSGLYEGMVQVELPVELEDGTDAYDLLPHNSETRAPGNKGAVNVHIVPDTRTRLSICIHSLKTTPFDRNG